MSEDFKNFLNEKVSAQLVRVDTQSERFLNGEVTHDAQNASAYGGHATAMLARVAFDIAR